MNLYQNISRVSSWNIFDFQDNNSNTEEVDENLSFQKENLKLHLLQIESQNQNNENANLTKIKSCWLDKISTFRAIMNKQYVMPTRGIK